MVDTMLKHDRDSKEFQDFRIPEEFSNCAGKLYWIGYVLTGDDQKVRELILPTVDDMAEAHTFFGEWLCKWMVRTVVMSCARHHSDELRQEQGSGDRWRSRLVEYSSVKLQTLRVSKDRLQRALLRIPLFPRFVFLLRVLEGYSMPVIARILDVDEDSCEGSLSYAYLALAQALMPAQEPKELQVSKDEKYRRTST